MTERPKLPIKEPQTHKYGENGRDLTIYSNLMDAALKAKAASIMSHFGQLPEEAVIVDVGSGTGQLAEYIARELHNPVYAVDRSHDMLAIAEEGQSKVELVYDDACYLHQIPSFAADIIYHGTVGHEIYSSNGKDGINSALKAAYRSLKNEGKEIWRDFVKAPDKTVYLQILTNDGVNTIEEATINGFLDYSQLSTRALFDCFYQEFKGGKAFDYEIIKQDGRELIKLPAQYAQEFILRKDYTANWRQEIQEEYTYLTEKEAETAFQKAGFSQVKIFEDDNEYIRNNRLKGKVALYEEKNGNLEEVEFPTHMVIVGIKTKDHQQGNKTGIDEVDYQSLANSVVIENNVIEIGEKKLVIDEFLGQGAHKQVYKIKDQSADKVIKIVRKDKTTFNSTFSSLQQTIEREGLLDKMNVPHMKVLDYDREGPPYRYLIQEALPAGSLCAADLIKDGRLNEQDVAQMAEIINRFEFGRQWQIDSNPFNWFRINKGGQTEMVYVAGTVYRYNEAWSFDKVGLLQWINTEYVLNGQFCSARIPTKQDVKKLAKNWGKMKSKEITWWKKYLNHNFQPGKSQTNTIKG